MHQSGRICHLFWASSRLLTQSHERHHVIHSSRNDVGCAPVTSCPAARKGATHGNEMQKCKCDCQLHVTVLIFPKLALKKMEKHLPNSCRWTWWICVCNIRNTGHWMSLDAPAGPPERCTADSLWPGRKHQAGPGGWPQLAINGGPSCWWWTHVNTWIDVNSCWEKIHTWDSTINTAMYRLTCLSRLMRLSQQVENQAVVRVSGGAPAWIVFTCKLFKHKQTGRMMSHE